MKRLLIYLLALGAFFVATAELVVAGILGMVAHDLHVSIGLAGQLTTAFSLSYAIGTPILVRLTSRVERRKVLIGSLLLFFVGCMASFESSQYTMLLVARMVTGLGAGVYTAIAMSSVAKLVPANKVGSAIGIIIVGFSGAMVLGIPMGTALAHWLNWHDIFIVIGLATLLIVLGMIRLLPAMDGDAPTSLRQQVYVLGNPFIASGLFISFAWNSGNSLMYTYSLPFLEDILHINVSDVGLVFLVLGTFSVIGTRFGGLGVDKWGTPRIMFIGMALTVISLACLSFATASYVLGLIFIVIWISSMFVTDPSIQTYFVQHAPKSSNFVSLNLSITHFGVAIGAAVGGMVVTTTSTVLHNPFAASCIYGLDLVTAIVTFALSNRQVTGRVAN